MHKKTVKMPISTKQEVSDMVRNYLASQGKIKKCPTRYAFGVYRSTLTSVAKQNYRKLNVCNQK